MSFSDDLEGQREEVARAVHEAGSGWAQAMRAHKLAPPDAGFAVRLRALADAASTERFAWEQAHAAGMLWRPVPDAENSEPPYELRPGTGRRGPAPLWEQFDAAVSGLNLAIAGSDAAVVAGAFNTLAQITAELADAVTREDDAAAVGQARARGAA